ncbi:hypothetical protein [Sphaerimonospora mesophila]|uniref:hypothetical protein n=1 Tax=Sphaerimonospora mesophila TaxID=37483 RepID=UPI000A8F6BBB
MLPDRGLYAQRRDEVLVVADAAPGRELIEIAANHNVPMTQPAEPVRRHRRSPRSRRNPHGIAAGPDGDLWTAL